MRTPETLAGSLVLRRYRLDDVLSSGGMGVVYRATHLRTGRKVAVKLLHERGDSERFEVEARAAAELKHPNVVDVLDMDEDEHGMACLVLELLEGEALAAVLDVERCLPAEQCLQWLLPIMGAVAVAHDRGMLHRDLKPANIFIARGPKGTTVPKLLDFGIVRRQSHPSTTATGAVVGTPSYMSPEQARGEPGLLATSDVWGMGVVWFRCLTGRLPFEQATAVGTLVSIVHERAPRIASVTTQVPSALGRAIDRALQRDPRSRYHDMREFARALLASAQQDGLQLPVDPDPTGLPDWSTWLTDRSHLATTGMMAVATSQSAPLPSAPAVVSRPGEQAQPAVLPLPPAGAAPRPTLHRSRWSALLLILTLLSVAGVRWLRNGPTTAPTSVARPLKSAHVAKPTGSAAPRDASPTKPPTQREPGVSSSLREDEF